MHRRKWRCYAVVIAMTIMFLANTINTAFSPILSKEIKSAQDSSVDKRGKLSPAKSPNDFYSNLQYKNKAFPENLRDFLGLKVFDKNTSFDDIKAYADFAAIDDDSMQLIVGVNNADPNAYPSLLDVVSKNRGKIVNTVSIRGKVIALVADMPLKVISSFVGEIQKRSLSRYIEPNMKVQVQLVPNDPYWTNQWGPKKIEADYAWNTTTGDPSVMVAVVDTGIFYTHDDLAANYVSGGYDWANNDADPMDDHGHGTHCAGIIAAVLNNGIGIAGLAQIRIMAEKVLTSGGWGYWNWIANGIINATDCGANIISMSIGGYSDSELVREAVKYAYDSGALIVAAAGNDNTNMKLYPAGYDEVIAVAATDQYDNKASFSNWGDWIELAAPGVSIYSTVPWGYEYASGTSMACPHVSGVAALAWSQYSNKSRDWLRMWLRYTADDLGSPGFDVYYGHGRVNARKSVEEVPPEHELIVSIWQTPPYVEPSATALINATILNFGENNETGVAVQLFANDTIVDSTSLDVNSGETAAVSLSWTPSVEGLYNVTLYVVPVAGETLVANNVVQELIYVGIPLKAVVLHSAGNTISDIIINWEILNSEWYRFGGTAIYIDYMTLNKDNLTYEDLVASEADVLIISCAYDPYSGWEFTNAEIAAIERYVHEGHGLIATAGTFYYGARNNNKLAPLFGLNETIMWTSTITSVLELINVTHPVFRNVPDPLIFLEVGTAISPDGLWDSNELVGGEYLALGPYLESAIVAYRGLLYISPWLEIVPALYEHHLQLLYNAITWSHYQKPEHELVSSLEAPKYLEPDQTVLLNATVSNMGLNNETNVELYMLINGTEVASATISELVNGTSYTINYTWTPSEEGIYNVTAYAPSVTGEEFLTNNIVTELVSVRFTIGYVIFEEAHLPAYTIGSNPAADIAGGYSEFAEYLTVKGYLVSTINPGTIIEPSVLEPADVLVIVAPQLSYLTSELDAIENWVKAGGNLLLISDWVSFGLQARTIATRFGVNMRGDGICDYDENVGYLLGPYYSGANILASPITAGVARVEMYGGDGVLSAPSDEIPLIITDSDGSAFWYTDSSPAMGVSVMNAFHGGTAGFGKLIVMTDSNIWDSAYDVDGDGDVNFYDSDNEILALNSMNWFMVQYQHELTVSVDAPERSEPSETWIINATVYNLGLSNETNVQLRLLMNSTLVNSITIPEFANGTYRTINYSWTPTTVGTYNITAYVPPVSEENVTTNNIATKMVRVSRIEVALISAFSELTPLTPILDSMGMGYDVYNNNNIYLYTENLTLLLRYKAVIFYNRYRWITTTEYSTLESYLSSGGNLLVTGYDCLVSDRLLADLVRSISIGDNVGEYELIVIENTHPIMDGPYGSFPARYHIYSLYGDCDRAEADTAKNALTVAELADGYDKVIATEGLPGKVVFWNGDGSYDWNLNNDCKIMFKNLMYWFTIQYQHELVVYLKAPEFLEPGISAMLNATVQNAGINDENDVNLQLLINGTLVENVTIPLLVNGTSHTINHLWTPMVAGEYNITVYAPPVSDEIVTRNNVYSRIISVKYAPKILAYVEYADYTQEYSNTLRAIESTFGPNYNLTELWDYTQLDSMLVGKDVLLIPEQEFAYLYLMEMVGSTWSSTLSNFIANGGIIVVCDYSGGTYGILTGAGLMSISGANYRSWSLLYLVDPSDPLAMGVSSSFIAPDGTISFVTGEANVVVNDGTYPVVIHKEIGLGHIVLLGFDFYTYNNDTCKILGNALTLIRYITISINPSSGSPGTKVTISGTKATANGKVSIYWDDTFVGNTTANNLGDFTYLLIVPSTATIGVHEIRAVDIVAGKMASQPFRVLILTLNPSAGPVGTKVTVKGAGFTPDSQARITFNDMLMGYALVDSSGNFTFVFNVPVATAEMQLVKAYEAEGFASATFTVVDVTPLDVQIDVGELHFRGEVAEFYAQTSFKGKAVNATITSAVLYKPDGTSQSLSAQQITTGLYKLSYTIPGNAGVGTYTLVIAAEYLTDTIQASGTSFKCFQISLTLSLLNATIMEINEGIATVIVPDLGMIKLNLTAINATLDNIFVKVLAINGTTATIQTTIGIVNGTITGTLSGDIVSIVVPGLGQIQADISSLKEAQETSVIPQYAIIVISLIAAAGATLSVMLLRRRRTLVTR